MTIIIGKNLGTVGRPLLINGKADKWNKADKWKNVTHNHPLNSSS